MKREREKNNGSLHILAICRVSITASDEPMICTLIVIDKAQMSLYELRLVRDN